MKPVIPLALMALFLVESAMADEKQHATGYTDTPVIPGSKWKVHDDDRPRPPVVAPGGEVTWPAPADAIVLFDGKNLDEWTRKGGGDPGWKLVDGTMEVVPKSGDLLTKREFGDVQLHLEWHPHDPPESNSQHRSNSGVFFFDRYEVQILDCYENKTYGDGMAGAIYGQYPPLVNAANPPSKWQTYDIVFIAPRFKDDGSLESPAKVTVFLNGILVQHATELLGNTPHKRVGSYKAHGPKGPIRLQDHRDQPIRFRNIWIRELDFSKQRE
ncbi:MAG: DUF1080 domain-containing protein [Akkermansiaceae bacterium]|nr:DUF1080 domain-containing protein [Akkermansiaceae bacterium]NNM28255.1 DUF1080 domain-containing protein [Akkermansiaceae bacterium]